MTEYNVGRSREAVRALIQVLVETTSAPEILRYRRSLGSYAEDPDRSWLDTTG